MKEHKKRPVKWDDTLGGVLQVIWKNKQYLFVAVSDQNVDQFEIFDTIVHEAVHVWQFMREWIGEHPSTGQPPEAPATEMEAYSIAYIAKTLLKEYANAVDEKRETGL